MRRCPVQPAYHNAVGGFQPIEYYPLVPEKFADRNRAVFGDVLVVYHHYIPADEVGAYRRFGHEHVLDGFARPQEDFREHSGVELLFVV